MLLPVGAAHAQTTNGIVVETEYIADITTESVLPGDACFPRSTTTTTAYPSDPSNPQNPPEPPSECAATFVLGSDHPDLAKLRLFRDGVLAESMVGRKIIAMYYSKAESINASLSLLRADHSPRFGQWTVVLLE